MAASALDAEPVNPTFQSVTSSVYTGRPSSVMLGSDIRCDGQSQQLRILGNFNRSRYIRDVLECVVSRTLPSTPLWCLFQKDNARPHIGENGKPYFSATQIQLLHGPAYSPDMPPFEYIWDFVGRHLARDDPVVDTDEIWIQIEAICDGIPHVQI